jgi:negative regulator of flagellin synthesis FlgM
MRISDIEVKKALHGIADQNPAESVEALKQVLGIEDIEEAKQRDNELVADVTQKVMDMPDREEMINRLRAKIEAGEYNPSAEEIVDTMARRAIADRMR